MAGTIDVRLIADLSHSNWVTIGIPVLAGLMGAVLGGAIGLVGQRQVSEAAAKQRELAELERQRSVAINLLIKIGLIHSHYKMLNSHVSAGLQQVREGKFDRPWQAVQALGNPPYYIRFNGDELVLVYLTASDKKIFNDLMMKDELHNAAIKGFEVFGERRTLLVDQLPTARMRGIVGEFKTDEALMLTLRPKMAELDDMIDTMVQFRQKDQDDAFDLLCRLAALFNEKLDLKFVPTRTVLGMDEPVIKAA